MDAKTTLENYQNILEPLLAAFFAKAEPEAKAISPESLVAIRYLSEYSLRKAKRLRAALCYYTYLMMGGKQKKEAMKASMFIEIIFAAKAIERMGDHAKNMSEYVVYMVKGKDVRHTSVEEIEKEVSR